MSNLTETSSPIRTTSQYSPHLEGARQLPRADPHSISGVHHVEGIQKEQQKTAENSSICKALSALRHEQNVLSRLISCGHRGARMLVGYGNVNATSGAGTLRYNRMRDAIDVPQNLL